ncbi:hypothetical protein H8S90_09300 [Olivibacter sp. SDN3]|uniref:RCC1 domain-containing protein n=1 Tax=Olivibacter sp. SDN3 TaxID=2764720 RepID=UPI0016515F48|nr:RCC1 domain-containing protein [Olivibacter sp. SDN3]QNL51746.1 hypothetical protein H8S90_09300 [Olivibacter sp. SDN3]
MWKYLMMALLFLPGNSGAQTKAKTTQEAVEQVKQNVETLKNLFRKKSKDSAKEGQGEPQGMQESTISPLNVQVVVGYYHVLAIADGVLYGWGDNTQGQLGLGVLSKEYTPRQIGTTNDWKMVAAAFFHSLAIKQDGSLWAWGWGNSAEMGLGQGNSKAHYPTQVGIDNDWRIVSTASSNSVGLKNDGTLWVWGSNVNACLGVGKTANSSVYIPTKVGTDQDWNQAVAGQHVNFAIKSNGTLWAWGRNTGSNILGIRTVNDVVQVPTQVGVDSDWENVYVHSRHGGASVVAVKKDGTVWTWGSNRSGKLGLGDEQERLYPERLTVEGNWIDFAFGDNYTIALEGDGSLWHSGNYQRYNATKIGEESGSTVLKRMHINGRWREAHLGMNFTALVDLQGNIWTYGINANGQLGWGVKESSDKLVKVALPTPVIANKTTNYASGDNGQLSQGAALLFGDLKCKLSIAEKNSIYSQLGFAVADDGKRFILGAEAKDYPFEAYVFPTDLNKDGMEEYFILYGNSYTSGMTGSNIIAFLKVSGGADYQAYLGFPGTLPDVLEAAGEEWPDLVIGGPGFELPVWRWDGGKYNFHRKISSSDLAKSGSVNIEDVSKKYLAIDAVLR